MKQPAAASPALRDGGFAGILATFAAPAQKLRSDWDDAGLADDVATLSYEQALRNHARYRPVGDLPPEQDAEQERHQQKKLPSEPIAAAELPSSQCANLAEASAARVRRPATLHEARKASSITVRLSKAECAQLHQRAAEAGLTISAYLRFCTCEVETLRAQVKEALAQLRPSDAKDQLRPDSVDPATTYSAWSRLVSRWKSRGSAARD